LALARGIVDMHGGRLEAGSDGTDRGAVFTIWLPASPASVMAHANPLPASSATRHVERQVLVVDDNRDAADSLAQLVTLFGHRVAVAYDGPTALISARECEPDVVLCDIGLPGMDGYEVARRMRAEHPPVRMVAISGYAQAEDRRQAAEAGFEAHLAKPPKPDEIQRLLS
jgi:CheY-like chemotaxis protein